MAARAPVKVVEFVDPGAKSALGGTKRPRSEIAPSEREAFLGGAASAIAAAGASASRPAAKPPSAKRPAIADDKKIRVNFKDIFQDVASFGAASFTGKDKKVWEMKQLNALGAGLKFKEKMPMKMWLGVSAARKKKEAKKAEEARVSGVISGKKFGKKKEWRAGKKSEEEMAGHPADITPSNMRGPVMYVKKARS